MTYLPTWASSTSSLTAGPDATPALQYVNSASTTFSQWDLSIAFRVQRPVINSAGETVDIAADEVVRVVMSPTHAKVLAHFLDVAVTEWETKFGELPSVERLMPTAAPEEPVRTEPHHEEPIPAPGEPEEPNA